MKLGGKRKEKKGGGRQPTFFDGGGIIALSGCGMNTGEKIGEGEGRRIREGGERGKGGGGGKKEKGGGRGNRPSVALLYLQLYILLAQRKKGRKGEGKKGKGEGTKEEGKKRGEKTDRRSILAPISELFHGGRGGEGEEKREVEDEIPGIRKEGRGERKGGKRR